MEMVASLQIPHWPIKSPFSGNKCLHTLTEGSLQTEAFFTHGQQTKGVSLNALTHKQHTHTHTHIHTHTHTIHIHRPHTHTHTHTDTHRHTQAPQVWCLKAKLNAILHVYTQSHA